MPALSNSYGFTTTTTTTTTASIFLAHRATSSRLHQHINRDGHCTTGVLHGKKVAWRLKSGTIGALLPVSLCPKIFLLSLRVLGEHTSNLFNHAFKHTLTHTRTHALPPGSTHTRTRRHIHTHTHAPTTPLHHSAQRRPHTPAARFPSPTPHASSKPCLFGEAAFHSLSGLQHQSTRARVPAACAPPPPPLLQPAPALSSTTLPASELSRLCTTPIGNAQLENLEASDITHRRTSRRTAFSACCCC